MITAVWIGSCKRAKRDSALCGVGRDVSSGEIEAQKGRSTRRQKQAAAALGLPSFLMLEAQAPVTAKADESISQTGSAPAGLRQRAATKGFVARLRSHTPERGAHRPCGPEPTSGVSVFCCACVPPRFSTPAAHLASPFPHIISATSRLPCYFPASYPPPGFRYS